MVVSKGEDDAGVGRRHGSVGYLASYRRVRCFHPWSVHVRSLVDKMALGQVFIQVLPYSLSVSFYQCPTLIHLSPKLYNFTNGQHC
jgi:hypothetical protein